MSLFGSLRLFDDYSWLLKLFDHKQSSNNWYIIWWLFYWMFAVNNSNNQKSENKMWIPRPFLTKNLTHDISYYLTYLMIIWWLFDDYLMIICIILVICCIEILHCYVLIAKMWRRTTRPFLHSPCYAASHYLRTGLHGQWR